MTGMLNTQVGYGIKHEAAITAAQVLAASIGLALMAQVAIPLPFTPVPLSLQTVAIFFIALTLGPKKGSAAVLVYLLQGTLGLPVFTGGFSNALWFIGPRAGYLIGFVIAVWLIGTLVETQKERTFLRTFLALAAGEGVILLLGAVWLTLFVGFPNTIYMGIYPFLMGDALKILLVTFSGKMVNNLLKQLF